MGALFFEGAGGLCAERDAPAVLAGVGAAVGDRGHRLGEGASGLARSLDRLVQRDGLPKKLIIKICLFKRLFQLLNPSLQRLLHLDALQVPILPGLKPSELLPLPLALLLQQLNPCLQLVCLLLRLPVLVELARLVHSALGESLLQLLLGR